MLRILPKLPTLLILLSPCLIGAGTGLLGTQGSTQAPAPSVRIYLPPGDNETSIMPMILARLGEPSLLEAAKDSKNFSLRVSFFSPVPTNEVAVRLVINDDGGAEITSAVSTGKDAEVKRTKNSLAKADVDKLLELVRKAEFWSAAKIEQEPSDGKPKPYLLDGAFWMLEGVHGGSFHYVFRQNPNPNPITEIGCFMAKDLVKPVERTIPMAGCPSRTR